MQVLITGSDGVVGREIAYLLSKSKKYNLILLTNNKIKKNKKKIFYQDLTKPINHKLKIDAIIHCAAKNPLSKIGSNPQNIYSTNIKMTKNIINFSNKNNVKKIIFLSAMDVYGSIKKRILFENQKAVNPNLYGKSKSLSEKLFCSKKNSFNDEFDKVWIHGFLHLLGFDHKNDKDYFKMQKIEKKVLNSITK